MALTVIQRPQTEIYSSTNPDPYEPPLFVSYWNASALPLVYKLESDLFPNNYIDTIDSIAGVTNYNGFAMINLDGVYSTYQNGDYIKITDSSVDAYNGIWQIRFVSDANSYAINCAYVSNATAFAQKYYKNYNAVIKIYAGLPTDHPMSAQKPLSLVTTVNIMPDTENVCYLNVQEVIQRFLPFSNNLDTINVDAFTGFYIEFAESYYEGGEEVTTAFTNDVFGTCNEAQQIINGTFDTNLSGWFQTVDYYNSWVQSSGKAQVSGFGFSQMLYQPVEVNNGKSYTLNIDYSKSQIPDTWFYVFGFNSEDISSLNFTMLYAGRIPLSGSLSKEIIMPQAFDYVGFQVFSRRSNTTVTLDNITLTLNDAQPCLPILWATNSAQQFRYRYNGSMGEYLIFPINNIAKYLTGTWSPTLFKDNYLDLSIIAVEGIGSTINQVIKQYDDNGVLLAERVKVVDYQGGGVYRLPIEQVYNTKGTITSELRTIISADYYLKVNEPNYLEGTYYSDIQFQLSDTFSLYAKFRIEEFGSSDSFRLFFDSAGTIGYFINVSFNGQIAFFVNATGQSFAVTNASVVKAGVDYELLVTFNANSSLAIYLNGIDVTSATDISASGTVSYSTNYHIASPNTDFVAYIGDIKIFDAVVSDASDDTNLVFYLPFCEGEGNTMSNLYSTGVSINGTQTTTRGANNTWVYPSDLSPVDDINAPNEYNEVVEVQLSEVKTINFDPSCYKYPLYLTWLNTLGGWDYWLFTAKKDYGIEVDDVVTAERNIFQSFPDNFQNETWDELVSLQARNMITVRSQPMTKEQLVEVSKLVYSKMVQIMESETSKYTILIDKRSISQYTDGDKLYFLEFDIMLPKIITQ